MTALRIVVTTCFYDMDCLLKGDEQWRYPLNTPIIEMYLRFLAKTRLAAMEYLARAQQVSMQRATLGMGLLELVATRMVHSAYMVRVLREAPV